MNIIPVILTVHTLIVLALIALVLLQRSDGGALGLGGGGGGFMTGRGAANTLTRTTAILAALFFSTSISLALLARPGEQETDIIEGLTGEKVVDPNAPVTADDLLKSLGSESPSTPAPDAGAVADPVAPTTAEDLSDTVSEEPAADGDPATPDAAPPTAAADASQSGATGQAAPAGDEPTDAVAPSVDAETPAPGDEAYPE